jgi:hypothetical protein
MLTHAPAYLMTEIVITAQLTFPECEMGGWWVVQRERGTCVSAGSRCATCRYSVTCHLIRPIPLHGKINYHKCQGGAPIAGRSHDPFLGSLHELELNIYRFDPRYTDC